MSTSPAVAVLRRLLEEKPGAVNRPGQEAMTDAVAEAIRERSHLLVEAGTGTGKSLAYLSAAYASNRRVVVSTATKALQDQLAHVELPFLAEHSERAISWAVVKGRASYVCMAKLDEQLISPDQIGLLDNDQPTGATVASIAEWARGDVTGDRDDLPTPVSASVWDAVSVSGMECPGATRCPRGQVCFAEAAIDRSRSADVTVTNHHLYALHLATGRRLLPDHDAVVFDEGHKLEDAVTAAFTLDISGRRLTALAGRAAPHLGRGRGNVLDRLRRAADELDAVIAGLPAARVDPGDGAVGTSIAQAISVVGATLKALPKPTEGTPEAGAVARVATQGGHVSGDFAMAMGLPDGWVAWTEPLRRTVRVAPIEVAPSLAAAALVHLPVVVTSATLTVGGSFAPTARRLGFVDGRGTPPPLDVDDIDDPLERTYASLRIEGAFDYATQGLLYVAAGLPPPGDPGWPDAAGDEAQRLVAAAGGRALILTTSHAMVERFSSALAGTPFRVLAQGDESKRRLIAEFSEDETAVLVATMGFWEGIDVPGPSLSLVVVDRLPFPRPNDPPMQAKRDAVTARGGSAFDEVDLPRAATLLAQGAGRLIRSERDRGVVAVLDGRLATRRYGRRILLTLPGFARTSDGARARRYLESLQSPGPSGGRN